ncbi:MAG: hypothetical protein N3C60_09200 [Calditerrivibrio sp.]|nr:hypothetical protein [Calditerrivibrio sp.]
MDDYIRSLSMSSIGAQRFNIEQLIESMNKGEAILLDIRYGFELDVWEMKIAKHIPLNELPDRLNELPKDKIIVCACPLEARSNIACQYLSMKGYNAKYLLGGLLGLAERLKGGQAKDVKLTVC